MKPIILIFTAFFISVFNFSMVLSTPGTDEKESTDIYNEFNNEMVTLTNKVCDLLEQGYSPENIISMLGYDQKDSDYMQKLATLVQKITNKQPSQKNVVNILIFATNKKTQESDKQHFFWLTKNRLLILKIIAVILLVAVIWYLISRITRSGFSGPIQGLPSPKNNVPSKSKQELAIAPTPHKAATVREQEPLVSQQDEKPKTQTPEQTQQETHRTVKNGFSSVVRETAHINYKIRDQLREAIAQKS